MNSLPKFNSSGIAQTISSWFKGSGSELNTMNLTIWIPTVIGLLVVSFAGWYFFRLWAKKKRNHRDYENDIYESSFFDRDERNPKRKSNPLIIEPTRPRADPFIEGLEFKERQQRQDDEKAFPLFPEDAHKNSKTKPTPTGFDDGGFFDLADQDPESPTENQDPSPPTDDDDLLLHKLKKDFNDLEKELRNIKENEIRKEPAESPSPVFPDSSDSSDFSDFSGNKNSPSQLDDEIIADFEAILAGNQIEPVVPVQPEDSPVPEPWEEPSAQPTSPLSEIQNDESSAELEREIDQHDEAISKLKQEMEQTIHEISSQLNEDLENEEEVPASEDSSTPPLQAEPAADWVQKPITNLGPDFSRIETPEESEKKSDQLIGQLNQFQKNLEDRFALISAETTRQKNVVPDWLQKSPSRPLGGSDVKGGPGFSWNRPDVQELLESFIFTSKQRKKNPNPNNGIN